MQTNPHVRRIFEVLNNEFAMVNQADAEFQTKLVTLFMIAKGMSLQIPEKNIKANSSYAEKHIYFI